MKATDLLVRQHREVRALFAKIEKSESRERTQLLDELARQLAAHMVIEQEIFYPACSRALNDLKIVAESFEEHGVAAFQLNRVLHSRARDTTLEAKVKVLRELIENHVEEEEKELLPQVRRAIDDAELEELGRMMLDRFESQLEEGAETVLSQPPPDAREALKKRGPTSGRQSGARVSETGARVAGTTRRKAARGTRKKSTEQPASKRTSRRR